MKPDLLIHAGLPKCATSSLQRLFVARNHHISTALDLCWIGRGFAPGGPGVPVSEIMYDKEAAKDRIRALRPDPSKRYLLSSEALSGHLDIFDVLAERFEIRRIVLSLRFPMLVALSGYCFSGWLTDPPETVDFPGRHDQICHAIERLAAVAPVTLCPIEAPDLATRFCQDLVGTAPADVETAMSQGHAANRSISPALAIALNAALQTHGITGILGPARAICTRVAQNHPGRPRFGRLMPEPFRAFFHDTKACQTQLQRYGELMSAHGVNAQVIDQSLDSAGKKLVELQALDPVDPQMAKVLRYRANWNLAHIQKLHPDALPKSAPDLQMYRRPMQEVLGETL